VQAFAEVLEAYGVAIHHFQLVAAAAEILLHDFTSSFLDEPHAFENQTRPECHRHLLSIAAGVCTTVARISCYLSATPGDDDIQQPSALAPD
jgi:hypothetical protein